MATVKKPLGSIASFIVIIPILPFYLMAVAGEKAQEWKWPHFFCDISERILDWSERN